MKYCRTLKLQTPLVVPEPQLHVRWLIRRDLPAVLNIEHECFQHNAWSEDEFISCLRQRNCIALVCESTVSDGYQCSPQIVGFIVYLLNKYSIEVINLAVHPAFHRQRVGTTMIDKIKGKLYGPRRMVEVTVCETNLMAQQFFRFSEFRCVTIQRDPWDMGLDGYLFRYVSNHIESYTDSECRGR